MTEAGAGGIVAPGGGKGRGGRQRRRTEGEAREGTRREGKGRKGGGFNINKLPDLEKKKTKRQKK